MTVLLIGGYPKGHDRPFHPATLSGKRLKAIVEELGLDATYIDLWSSEREEREGKIDPFVLAVIRRRLSEGVTCFALGRWVHKRLVVQGVEVPYLPHPAARRKIDQQRLRDGLRAGGFC